MPPFRPKVDYSLRPAKSTVRQMVVETLGRLGPLVPVDRYRYVGMGSIYFRDFQIVHRRLGINDMITIEGNRRAEERVRFNLPLACIELIMDDTSRALPQIPIEDGPHILWLDYESRVNQGVLSDADETAGRCASKSVLIVTVNAERPDGDERERWLSEFGDERPEPSQPHTKAEYALFSYRVLRERIDAALDSRNAARPKKLHVKFHQMFHMIHADGVQMLTFGGVLVAETDRQQLKDCGIGSLEFTRPGEKPYRIKIPRLTRREVLHLLSKMPNTHVDVEDAASKVGIPASEVRELAAVYRHAPLFVEAEDW